MAILNYFRKHKRLIRYSSLVIIVIGVILMFVSGGSPDAEDGTQAALAKVGLIKVGDFQQSKARISTTGQVESLNQVEFRSQVSAPVKEIFVGLGDSVFAGQTIVTFANEDIAAQLKQAEANLEAAQARLDEVKRGARVEELSIKQLQLTNAQKDLEDLYDRALDTLNSTYIQSDNIVRNQLSLIFYEVNSRDYKLTYQSCASQGEIDSKWQRKVAEFKLEKWPQELADLTFDSSQAEIDQAIDNGQVNLVIFKDLLEYVNQTLIVTCVLNDSKFDGYRAVVNGARSAMNGLIMGLNGLEQGIASAGLNIARIEEELGLLATGASDEQIKAQEAQFKVAEANVSFAQAQYNKTVIVSPIAGNISSLPLRQGELVTPGQLISAVVSTSGLKIKTYIDASDFAHVYPEDRVVIENSAQGFVLRIAPSVDSITKKVEIEIMVENPLSANLVIGQFANVEIITNNGIDGEARYILPLQAVKLTSEAAFVYGVDENDEIVEYQVELGQIIGESIEVLSGLDSAMDIVSAVRGLELGQKVSVK